MKKLSSIITAAAMIAAPVYSNAFAADGPIYVDTCYGEFNENDVNGIAAVILPENSTAKVKITLDSPEETAAAYYDASLDYKNGSDYAMKLEGYDSVIDENGAVKDGRVYNISLTAADTKLNLTTASFEEKGIVIPDGDNDPYSAIAYVYVIQIVQSDSDVPYTVETKESERFGYKAVEKTVTFYVAEDYVKGDVNDDGAVDSSDASKVLAEYALTATGNQPTFTDKQRKAGDVNEDGAVDSSDASKILAYYAEKATGGNPSWD